MRSSRPSGVLLALLLLVFPALAGCDRKSPAGGEKVENANLGGPTPAKTVPTGTHAPAVEPTRPSGKRQFKSGMVGIAKGQIARLNIVNTSDDLKLPSPTIFMGFVINPRSERLAQTTVTLHPGVSTFLDLSWDAVAGHGEKRHQVRAEVTAVNDPTSACVVTLEVFDNETGKTMVFLQIAEISPLSR